MSAGGTRRCVFQPHSGKIAMWAAVASRFSAMHAPANSKGFVDRFLRLVERGGNALPHPATLFLLLALLVILLSELAVLCA